LHLKFPPIDRQLRLPLRQNPKDFARYMGEIEPERREFEASFDDLDQFSSTKVFAT